MCPIRREAVPLVDAFDIPDAVLNFALGRYDGDMYRHLYEWAQKAPRNKSEVSTSWNVPAVTINKFPPTPSGS